MGRLKSWGSNLNPLFSGKYKKLLEEYGSKDYSRLLLQESLQDYLSYACRECGHVQKLQADELNQIVGHAFRLAYAAHLQKSASATTNHKSDLVIPTSQHLAPPHTPSYPITVTPTVAVSPNTSLAVSPNTSVQKQWFSKPQQQCQLGNVSNSVTSSLSGVASSPSCCSSSSSILSPASLNPVKEDLCKRSQRHHHQQRSPKSVNSSAEHSNSKRLVNNAALIKKLPVNLENNLEITLSNSIENTLENSLEIFDDCQPLVTSSPSSSSSISHGSPCHQVEQVTSSQVMSHGTATMSSTVSSTSTAVIGYINDKVSSDRTCVRLPSEAQCQDPNTKCNRLSDDDKMKCISQISVISSTSSDFLANDISTSNTLLGSPPPLPDRSDSLTPPEEPHLMSAAWFQAGIPREIALEVLSREPVGAFMVRESTSKPGCYALSLRVPRDFTVSGIAHYLIVKNSNGYKIKGFTKEFKTLSALITHHSVMPELLPCPLSLSRYTPTFTTEGQNTTDSNEEDPDYNTLSDFRKIMADLNV